jgi:hypothetical protein
MTIGLLVTSAGVTHSILKYRLQEANFRLILCYDLIHTYHLRFISEGVAEVFQIILQDTHVLPKLVSYEEHCRRDKW